MDVLIQDLWSYLYVADNNWFIVTYGIFRGFTRHGEVIVICVWFLIASIISLALQQYPACLVSMQLFWGYWVTIFILRFGISSCNYAQFVNSTTWACVMSYNGCQTEIRNWFIIGGWHQSIHWWYMHLYCTEWPAWVGCRLGSRWKWKG